MNYKNKRLMKNKEAHASFTVEAALTIPICFWVMYGLMYLFLLLNTQFVVYQSMLYAADKLYAMGTPAAYTANSGLLSKAFDELEENLPAEAVELISEGVMNYLIGQVSKLYIKELITDYYEVSGRELECVEDGFKGLECKESKAYEGDGTILINVSYEFEFPGQLFFLPDKEINQSLYLYGFYGTGWDKVTIFDDEGEEHVGSYVYITKSGEVYHSDRECTYISISLSQVRTDELSALRNASGGKYYACEYCARGNGGLNAYVTEYGDRYHSDEDCSRIYREAEAILKEEAEERGLRACSKCSEE